MSYSFAQRVTLLCSSVLMFRLFHAWCSSRRSCDIMTWYQMCSLLPAVLASRPCQQIELGHVCAHTVYTHLCVCYLLFSEVALIAVAPVSSQRAVPFWLTQRGILSSAAFFTCVLAREPGHSPATSTHTTAFQIFSKLDSRNNSDCRNWINVQY